MKINCIGCGYKVDLGNNYDDYEGQIKCFACGVIMEVAIHEGSIRSVKFVPAAQISTAPKVFAGGAH